MPTMTYPTTASEQTYIEVTGGVDTHKDTHTAAALDASGRLLGHREFAATAAGYAALLAWLGTLGQLVRVGVEGSGVYGAGLAQFLQAAGVELVGPRSAAERRSWTRRSPSPQVTDLHPPRNSANPWTHVGTVFEPTTSRDADEAGTRPQRPAITTAVSPTYPQPADLQQRHHDPQFRVIDHGQAVSIPSGTPRLA